MFDEQDKQELTFFADTVADQFPNTDIHHIFNGNTFVFGPWALQQTSALCLKQMISFVEGNCPEGFKWDFNLETFDFILTKKEETKKEAQK